MNAMQYKLKTAKIENIEFIKFVEQELNKPKFLNSTNLNSLILNDVQKTYKKYKIIFVDNKIAGLILLQKSTTSILLKQIYIVPNYRNKNIATNIIKNIIKKSSLPIELYVYKNNYIAINLYKKLRFNAINEINNTIHFIYNNEQLALQ